MVYETKPNTAKVFVENGIFNKTGVENLQAQRKPIIKVKANVDGKDVEIALYFKMVYDEVAERYTDEYFVTTNGNKMLKGKVENPYVANTNDSQKEEFEDEVPF
tara:strand:+ start:192 stop:503 length:312 start_codon:yes stop_codon:yes gene_type:complete